MAFGVDACQCEGNLLRRPALTQKMMHHTKQDALTMQLLGGPALSASLAATGGGDLAGVACVLGIALELSRDGTGRAFEPQSNLRERVLLVEQRGDGHAFFGLKLLIALG